MDSGTRITYSLANAVLDACCVSSLEVGLREDAQVTGRLSLHQTADDGNVHLDFIIEYGSTAAVDFERVVLRFSQVQFAEVMGHDYRWRPLAQEECVLDEWTPHCAHIVLSDGSHIECDGGDRSKVWVAQRHGELVDISYYFDFCAVHPFFYFSPRGRVLLGNAGRPSGEKRTGEIRFHHSPHQHNPLGWVRTRLPYGYPAAIVFTDHADYDQPETLRAIFFGHSRASSANARSGFVAEGLTVTKSIFVHSHARYTGVGLENKSFRYLVDELADAGIEIAPHLTRTTPTSREELRADLDVLKRYRLTTWIDHHFTLPQAVTGRGWDPNSEYYCLDILEEAGIEYLWSYWDISCNPPTGTLNTFSTEGMAPGSHLEFALGRAAYGERRRTLAERGYHLVEWLGAILGTDLRLQGRKAVDQGRSLASGDVSALKQLISETIGLGQGASNLVWQKVFNQSAERLPAAWPVFYEHQRLRQPRSGRNFQLFTSMRINDLGRAYSPRNIDRLIDERGVHVGHLYLGCNRHPLSNGAAFLPSEGGSGYMIAPEFADHLRYIGQRSKDGDLWCPPLRELGQYYHLSRMVSVEVESHDRVKLTNHGSQPVHGFSLVATRAKGPLTCLTPSVKQKSDNGWNVFWVDLAPHGVVYIQVTGRQ